MPDLDLYQGAYTGPQIDSSLAKVVGADTTPVAGSINLITSGGVKAALDQKSPAGSTYANLFQGQEGSYPDIMQANTITLNEDVSHFKFLVLHIFYSSISSSNRGLVMIPVIRNVTARIPIAPSNHLGYVAFTINATTFEISAGGVLQPDGTFSTATPVLLVNVFGVR